MCVSSIVVVSYPRILTLTHTLLRHGADVNLQNSDGFTALIAAADYGHERVVDLLLQRVGAVTGPLSG